jgi:hypothetical protein
MNSTLSSLAKAVSSFAPTLATMLGGPLAGTAVTALESAFGLAPGAGADAITSAAQAGMTPDIVAKVRAADQEHAEKMRQLDIDVQKLNASHEEAFAKVDADDRNSARQREVAVKDWTPAIIAFLMIFLYGGVQVYLLTSVINDDMREIVMRSLGTLDAAVTMVLGYYFGSSVASRRSEQPKA